MLGCSYWDPPKGADSCIQVTGNTFKLAVKKIEQSTPSREENRWLGTWQWWPAGCFWWMLSHWFPSLISSSCSIHTAESRLATTTCQQALLSLKQEVLADKTSNLCILGVDISTYNFKVASQLGHLRGHTYQGGRSNSISGFAGTNNICVMDVRMSPKPSVSFLARMHTFHKLIVESSREVKISPKKAGFKSTQCWGQESFHVYS